LLASIIESVVTLNPAPLIADIGSLIYSEMSPGKTEEFMHDALTSYIESGGKLSDFGKDMTMDMALNASLNFIDSMRHDIDRIEAGNYASANVLLSGDEETYWVTPKNADVRLIMKDGEYIWDMVNPVTDVIGFDAYA